MGVAVKPKKLIDLKIIDWWDSIKDADFEHNRIIGVLKKYLAHKYDFKSSNNPKYLLYSVFGNSHLDYSWDCVRICVAFENVCIDWNLADYGVSTHIMDFGERNLCFPYYFTPFYQNDMRLAVKKHLLCDKKEKFCSFMVSNGNADKIRDEFFEKLCEYKKVDSGGGWKNNIGGKFIADKHTWLQSYKFNLCFENSSAKGYVTEKIIQAFAAGCIPIYWGDESLCDEKYAHIRPVFNPKAFINVHNFDSIQSAIREIQRIDNDENAYNAMRKEPIFITQSLCKFLDSEKGNTQMWSEQNIDFTAQTIIDKSERLLVDFFDNIFEKGCKQIKYGQIMNKYFTQCKKKDRKTRILLNEIKLKRRSIEKFLGIYFVRKNIIGYFRAKFGRNTKK